MKKLIAIWFIIGGSFSFSQAQRHSVNSGYHTWQEGDIAMDYIIGEPFSSLSNSSFSITSIPLATLADSATGIYIANDIEFKIYPNPASTYIAFSIAQAGNWTVSLFDLAANKVADLHSGWLEANTETVLSLANLLVSSGNYFVWISNAKQNEAGISQNLSQESNFLAKIVILK